MGGGAIRGCGLSEIWLFIVCPRATVRALVHLLKDKMSQMVKINLITAIIYVYLTLSKLFLIIKKSNTF